MRADKRKFIDTRCHAYHIYTMDMCASMFDDIQNLHIVWIHFSLPALYSFWFSFFFHFVASFTFNCFVSFYQSLLVLYTLSLILVVIIHVLGILLISVTFSKFCSKVSIGLIYVRYERKKL